MEREMKDASLLYIGKVPKEWNSTKLKYLCEIKTGDQDTQNRKDDGKYLFYVRSPIVERSDTFSFEGDSILVAGDGAGAGRVFHLAHGRYAVHQRVYCLKLISKTNIKFLYYYLSTIFPMIMDGGSAQSTVPSIRLPMLTDLAVFKPKDAEQQKIADFLDEKVKEIDNAIEKTKETIELYKKYKQAAITEAVTKGLNPNVEMKNTYAGICPIKWNLKKIKYSCEMQAGDNITSNEVDTIGSYPVYGGNGIRGFYNKSNCNGEHILIGRQGALAGNVHYVDEKIWATDHAVVVSNFRDDVKFMFYMFIAMDLNQYAYDTAAQPGISVTKIKNLEMAFPSVEEEKEIACFLDDRTRKIDDIIFNKIAFIKKLEKYKKSLIYEYVTGKKEVQ